MTNRHIANPLWHGIFYDGVSAARKNVSVEITAEMLVISVANQKITWPLNDVTQTQGAFDGEPVRLERAGAALIVSNQRFIQALKSIAPKYASRFTDGGIQRKPALIWGGVAIASLIFVFFSYFIGIPAAASYFAENMPVSWEEKLGNAVLREFTSHSSECENAELTSSLNTIASRLEAASDNKTHSIKLHVVKSPVVNAFALPGGNIVLFTGLLRATKTPEELASVLAHEMQHVYNRHSTKGLIRGLSTYALLSLIFGDVQIVAKTATMLSNMTYSRELEQEADDTAIALLHKAKIDPLAMKAFFETINKGDNLDTGALSYLSSHPQTKDRIKNVEVKSSALKAHYPPLLPEADWRTLKLLCPNYGARKNNFKD